MNTLLEPAASLAKSAEHHIKLPNGLMPSAKNLYHVYHNKLVKQSHSWDNDKVKHCPNTGNT